MSGLNPSTSFQSTSSAGSLNVLQVLARAAIVVRDSRLESSQMVANISNSVSAGKRQICVIASCKLVGSSNVQISNLAHIAGQTTANMNQDQQ
jgi:hypothetical protein